MSYADFVFFMISEVDKTTLRSLQYWFRVFDLDDDGIISLKDIQYFAEQQAIHITTLISNASKINSKNIFWQILDLAGLSTYSELRYHDLQNSEVAQRCGK